MSVNPANAVVRAIYVNDYNTIVGNSVQETALLNWIQSKSINYVYCYDLNDICSTSAGRTALRALNIKLRQRGVVRIAGIGGSQNTLIGTATNSRASYNLGCSYASQRFDIFNLENEFWNYNGVSPYTQPGSNTALRFECNTTTDWNSQNQAIWQWGNLNGVETDFYIGLIRDGKTSPATPPFDQKLNPVAIATNLILANDRILVAAYMTSAIFTQSATSAYNQIRANLVLIGERAIANNRVTDIVFIFHGGADYMYSYFQNNTFNQAWLTMYNAYVADVGAYKAGIRLRGYAIYGYQQVKTL
jgi:hypothetical protein